jgi:hypothetical protein
MSESNTHYPVKEKKYVQIILDVPERALDWFQTFVSRAYFHTFQDLAENRDTEEAYRLRNAVYTINATIEKSRE